MAESIVKLRVDSNEYDAKIKRATENLNRYVDEVKKSGDSLANASKDAVDFVQALGGMNTEAKNTNQQVREMQKALTDLTMQYRSLTDEEKNSPFGKAMAQSIQQLTERAGAARDAMADVSAAINNAASDTRTFDQLSDGAKVVTSGFQTLQGATKMLGIDMGDNVEILAKLQAAMAVTNGLATVQNAIQKQSALMQGVVAVQAKARLAAETLATKGTVAATVAQKAFNLVAKANPYVLLATALTAVVGALAAFSFGASKAKKEEEELEKQAEETAQRVKESRDSFVSASAEAMNTASVINNLQIAYKNTNSEAEKTEILKQASEQFNKLGIACNSVTDAQRILVNQGNSVIQMLRLQGTVAALTALRMEAYKKSFSMIMENNGNNVQYAASLANYNGDVMALDEQISSTTSQMNQIKATLPMKGSGGGGGGRVRGGGGGGGTRNTPPPPGSIAAQEAEVQKLTKAWKEATDQAGRDGYLAQLEEAKKKLEEMQGKTETLVEGSMKALNKELSDLQEAQSNVATASEWNDYEEKIKAVKKQMSHLKGEVQEMATGFSGFNDNTISAWLSGQQSSLSGKEIGSADYMQTAGNIIDTQTLQNVVNAALKAGIKIDPEVVESLFEQILSGDDIPDSVWQDFKDKINEQLADGIEPLEIDVETGNVTGLGKQVKESWQDAAKAVQSVGSALQQLDDPAAKIAGIIGQAVAQIALGFAQATTADSGKLGVFGWIAAIAGGLGTMISTIAAIHSATGYAEGGIVKGNSYSGDNLWGGAYVNAGELVLNRAQQGALASQLEGASESGSMKPYTTGEYIYLGVKNHLSRSGQGEIVTTSMLKKMGLT